MESSTLSFRSTFPIAAADLFAWHERPGAFERMLAPWEGAEVVSTSGSVQNGERTELRVRVGPLWIRWIAEHTDYIAGRQFCDVQRRGPFAHWKHTHRVSEVDERHATLDDKIEFQLPLGALGRVVDCGSTVRRIERTFAYRHRVLLADLLEQQRWREQPRRKVIISGASGLVGRQLSALLTTAGHSVMKLVRHQPRADDEIAWNPQQGELDPAQLSGADAVIHLAGESIAGGRWTAAKKRRIRDSRLLSTRLLAERIAQAAVPPSVLLCAAAIGFYGHTGDDEVDESRPSGEGYLAEVCRLWESATDKAAVAGTRVVNLRFGVILSPAGGALRQMLMPFRLGVGGRIGSGTQWMSWIALDDALYAIEHSLCDPRLRGPINVVTPNPVTNDEFTRTLARVLRRPSVFPLPAAVARLALGEMADELLLVSQRVYPRKLVDAGFRPHYGELEPALRHLLGRT